MWRWMPACAAASITGPMSVDSAAGWPMVASSMAPFSMATMRSATSACRHSTRNAEQRCPAESKADAITSCTTCSASADESTMSAFCPPVSAISGTGWPSGFRRSASVAWMLRATSVEPVNSTPRVRASATSDAPTVAPSPGSSCSAPCGTPAACRWRTDSAAISGVCSAGLASTTLPAASAAATWPVKMASGKFHGLMHATGPSGTCVALSNCVRAWAA